MDCFTMNRTCESKNTTPARPASPTTCLASATCWDSVLRPAFAISPIGGCTPPKKPNAIRRFSPLSEVGSTSNNSLPSGQRSSAFSTFCKLKPVCHPKRQPTTHVRQPSVSRFLLQQGDLKVTSLPVWSRRKSPVKRILKPGFVYPHHETPAKEA
jgi:hypothetical protein